MPDLSLRLDSIEIRHPEGFEKTGFRLEFTPVKTGAGKTNFYKYCSLWTDIKYRINPDDKGTEVTQNRLLKLQEWVSGLQTLDTRLI